MIEKLGGRKFIIAILAVVLAFVLVIVKVVSSDQFVDFVKWIIGLFIAGNAVVNTAGIIMGE